MFFYASWQTEEDGIRIFSWGYSDTQQIETSETTTATTFICNESIPDGPYTFEKEIDKNITLNANCNMHKPALQIFSRNEKHESAITINFESPEELALTLETLAAKIRKYEIARPKLITNENKRTY